MEVNSTMDDNTKVPMSREDFGATPPRDYQLVQRITLTPISLVMAMSLDATDCTMADLPVHFDLIYDDENDVIQLRGSTSLQAVNCEITNIERKVFDDILIDCCIEDHSVEEHKIIQAAREKLRNQIMKSAKYPVFMPDEYQEISNILGIIYADDLPLGSFSDISCRFSSCDEYPLVKLIVPSPRTFNDKDITLDDTDIRIEAIVDKFIYTFYSTNSINVATGVPFNISTNSLMFSTNISNKDIEKAKYLQSYSNKKKVPTVDRFNSVLSNKGSGIKSKYKPKVSSRISNINLD